MIPELENGTLSERHHDIFRRFAKWNGIVEAGFAVNFLGVKTSERFHSLTVKHTDERIDAPSFPSFDEEYFEWIDLLEAVVDAREEFTMIELGAGYGRWLVNAAVAVRAYHGSLACKLIGVEPEPSHYEWMRTHFEMNGVPLGYATFIQAAASVRDGEVWFYVGRPEEWYGQAIASWNRLSWLNRLRLRVKKEVSLRGCRIRKVKAVGLSRLLDPFDRVDLIDLDVQGAELNVLQSAAEQLDQKVKRVHIGTHSVAIEAGLRTLFHTLGWINLNDYACGSECETPWGNIKFQDGVQSWVNPRLWEDCYLV
jgi:FkbM family methyltransferase